MEKQYKYIEGYIKNAEKEGKAEQERIRQRIEAEQAEKDKQEKEGVV